jgi:hypothetical protein
MRSLSAAAVASAAIIGFVTITRNQYAFVGKFNRSAVIR